MSGPADIGNLSAAPGANGTAVPQGASAAAGTVRITVKLYASLSKYLPEAFRKAHAMPALAGPTDTIETVLAPFGMPPGSVKLVVVNGVFVPPHMRATTGFVDGDVLAVWPPVAGG